MALLERIENMMPAYTCALKRANVTATYVLGLSTALLLIGCNPSETAGIRVEDAWSRPAQVLEREERGGTAAVYITLINEGRQADRLIGARTERAERVEMHQSVLDERQVMHMHPVNTVSLEPGETIRFEPGSYHFMLVGLKEDLLSGDTFSMTLLFEEEGERSVSVSVRPEGM